MNAKSYPEKLLIAPTHYLTGQGVVCQIGALARRYGPRTMVIHGGTGYGKVESAVLSSMAEAEIVPTTVRHAGPCTRNAVEAHAETANKVSADLIVGIGGGRVLDTAKGVADSIGRPYITVPTSPATCSAATAVVVYYDTDSVYLESRLMREPPVAAIVDWDIIAQVPDRLLVAGIVDALAKVHEVRFATGRAGGHSATASAALALCDGLEALMEGKAKAILGDWATAGLTQERITVAEAALLWPGLIGGLAGESSKLAAAHAIHNALTLLPGSKQSLHGEILAFGILVQQFLEGTPPEAIKAGARFFVALGCPCSLGTLGCGAFHTGEGQRVASRAVALPSMRRCFPNVSEEALLQVMMEVDTLALTAVAGT